MSICYTEQNLQIKFYPKKDELIATHLGTSIEEN